MLKTQPLKPVLAALERAKNRAELRNAIVALRDLLAIEHISYLWVNQRGDQYGCATYAPAWQDRYRAQNYHRIDPVILGCYVSFQPVNWKDLDWTSRAARQFRSDALKHGVGSQGFSVPVHGPNGQFALVSANHSCSDAAWQSFTLAHRDLFILMAHHFNRRALEMEPARRPEKARALSPREVDAMTLLASGYSRAEVANHLSISEHTVRVYIESARDKLSALNTTHAVARALSRGMIVV